jgi:uncharacterized protein YdhG (YjbR/CyaY superfamily)
MKRATGRASAATTIDGYLAALEADQRAALEKLRAQIHAAAPGCEECISYGLPTMRHGGRVLLHFGAALTHVSLYPGAIVAQFAGELAGFGTSKGTIRFTPDEPLSATLVKRIVKACLARNAVRGGARSRVATKAGRTATPKRAAAKRR